MLRATLDPRWGFRSGPIASVRLVEAGRPVSDPSDEGARLIRYLVKAGG